MKLTILAFLVGASMGMRLSGIDDKELMDQQVSHWRKNWPEGDTDNGDNDEDVMFNDPLPVKPRHVHAKVHFPWRLEDDVISTQDSIKQAEEKINFKLHESAVKDGGLDMINQYDNTKRVFERDLPYGH